MKYLKWFLILSVIGCANDAWTLVGKLEKREAELETFLRMHGYPLLSQKILQEN